MYFPSILLYIILSTRIGFKALEWQASLLCATDNVILLQNNFLAENIMFTLSICRHPTGKGFLALLQILLNFWVLKITDSIRFAYLVSGQPDKKKILDIRCICTNRFLSEIVRYR